MLRVTIELVPYGDEDRAKKIATMLIANDATGDWRTGNYAYVYTYTDRPSEIASGTVKNFPRSLGAWSLVKKILNKRTGETNELTERLEERL
jgi:hypothetical protein